MPQGDRTSLDAIVAKSLFRVAEVEQMSGAVSAIADLVVSIAVPLVVVGLTLYIVFAYSFITVRARSAARPHRAPASC